MLSGQSSCHWHLLYFSSQILVLCGQHDIQGKHVSLKTFWFLNLFGGIIAAPTAENLRLCVCGVTQLAPVFIAWCWLQQRGEGGNSGHATPWVTLSVTFLGAYCQGDSSCSVCWRCSQAGRDSSHHWSMWRDDNLLEEVANLLGFWIIKHEGGFM